MIRVFRFLSGVIIGALVGSTVAILLTPSSGLVLRERFAQNANRITDQIKQAAADKRAELENELTGLRSDIKIG